MTKRFLLALVLVSFFVPPGSAATNTNPPLEGLTMLWAFTENFERFSEVNDLKAESQKGGIWHNVVWKKGTQIEFTQDPNQGKIITFTVAAKTRAKADLFLFLRPDVDEGHGEDKRLGDPIYRGQALVVRTWFKFNVLNDHTRLIDIEVKGGPNFGKQPGLRLTTVKRNGRPVWRIARDKLQVSDRTSNVPVPLGEWIKVEIVVLAGGEQDGRAVLKVNDETVLDYIGTTMLTKELARIAWGKELETPEVINAVEFGCTICGRRSTGVQQTIYMGPPTIEIWGRQ